MPRGRKPFSVESISPEQLQAIERIREQFLASGKSIGQFVIPYGVRRDYFGQVMNGRRAPSRQFLEAFGYRYALVRKEPHGHKPNCQ